VSTRPQGAPGWGVGPLRMVARGSPEMVRGTAVAVGVGVGVAVGEGVKVAVGNGVVVAVDVAVGDGVWLGKIGVGGTAVGETTATPWLQAASSRTNSRMVILRARVGLSGCICC